MNDMLNVCELVLCCVFGLGLLLVVVIGLVVF